MVTLVQGAFAQKSEEELNAERLALKEEITAKKAIARAEKLISLKTRSMGSSGLSSLDALVSASKSLLDLADANEAFLSKFRQNITASSDGTVDISEEKAHLDDYIQLAQNITLSITKAVAETGRIASITTEIKSISPLKAVSALKAVKYATDALSVATGELKL